MLDENLYREKLVKLEWKGGDKFVCFHSFKWDSTGKLIEKMTFEQGFESQERARQIWKGMREHFRQNN